MTLLVAVDSLPAVEPCKTRVGGTIANQTWTREDSPYCVTNDVYVIGSLRIREGVEVRFDGNHVFEVAGRLRAEGTAEAPIQFHPANPAVGWQGLLFRDAVPGSYFVHTIIEGSKNSGVRITNTPPAFTNSWIINNTTDGEGAGINADIRTGAEFMLNGCVISNNTAKSYGGGVRLRIANSRFVAERCDFIQNAAGVYGGGFMAWAEASSLKLTSCSSISNVITHAGGSSGYCGIGVVGLNDNSDFHLELAGCRVIGNTVRSAGGGSWAYAAGIGLNTGTSRLRNCWIIGNSAWNGVARGGGVYLGRPAKATLENCVIAQNQIVGSSHGGAGIDGSGAINAQLSNCTLFGNGTENGTVTLSFPEGISTITNSVLWGGTGSGSVFSGSGFSVGYSCVQGGWPGMGNITANPALCLDNYSLLSLSPCVDAGHPGLQFRDSLISSDDCAPYARGTSRNDMGAYGGPGVCYWTQPRAEPVIRIAPDNQIGFLGQPVSLGVIATGAEPLAHQWFKSGVALAGRTNMVLTLPNSTLADAGAYVVEVTNPLGEAVSLPVQLGIAKYACVAQGLSAGRPRLLIRHGWVGERCVLYSISRLPAGDTLAVPGNPPEGWEVRETIVFSAPEVEWTDPQVLGAGETRYYGVLPAL
ncbi:MAG: hypothetical protein HS113_28760 [Verrucomicrobiales bacterium]|nr:hypothetical protein [Verrucomicrobiales bacterium]